jgi:hypothetical protein
MPRKRKPPKCCAPLCSEDAWHSVRASGDHGEFFGDLCPAHYDNFKACFPARKLVSALLFAVSFEELENL